MPSSTSALAWPYEGGFSTKVMIAGKVCGGGKTGGEWTEVCGMSASKYGGNLYQFAQQYWNYPYLAGSSWGMGQPGGLVDTTSITSPGTIPGANSTQFYPPLLGAAPEDAGAPVQVPDSEPSEGAL